MRVWYDCAAASDARGRLQQGLIARSRGGIHDLGQDVGRPAGLDRSQTSRAALMRVGGSPSTSCIRAIDSWSGRGEAAMRVFRELALQGRRVFREVIDRAFCRDSSSS